MAGPAFVGRRVQLSQIDGAITRCRKSSRPNAALVRGEMGSGETRLLAELTSSLAPALVLEVNGYELESRVPFAAANRLLRGLGTVGEEGPRLRALIDGPVTRLEPVQVLEAARRCMTEAGPVVVMVDDLQWVDRLTVALLHFLFREAEHADGPVAVVAVARPGPAIAAFGAAVRHLLPEADSVLDVELGPLDRADGARLVRALRPDLDESSATAIWWRAGGLPFWLADLARAEGATSAAAGVVGTRLAELSPDGATVVGLLAVSTAPTEPSVLETLLGWSATRTSAAADEVVDHGLAVRVGAALRVVHDAVRDATVSALPAQLVRGLHARIGRHQERAARGDTQRLRQALVHRRAASLPSGDLALRLLRSRNRRLLGPDDLRECVEIAAEAEPQDACTLLRQVALLASDLGRPDLALEQWTALTLRSASSAEREIARLRASQAALQSGDHSHARALLSDAPAVQLEPGWAIEWEAHVSEVAGNSGQDAESPMLRATTMARELVRASGGVDALNAGERHAYLAALQAEFYFALRTERPDRMLMTAQQIVAAADSSEGRLRGALHAVLAHRVLGQYAEAEVQARAVRLAAVREPLPAVAFLSGHLLASTLHSLGRLAEARAASSEVTALANRSPVVVPSWLSVAWVSSLSPEIDVSLHGWTFARDRLTELVELEPNPHFRLHIRMTIAQWAARLAHPSGDGLVVAHLTGAQADAAATGCDRCRSEVGLRAAEAYARIGQPYAARALLGAWDASHPEASGQSQLWRARAESLVIAPEHPGNAIGVAEQVCQQARSISTLRGAAQTARRLGAISEERRALQLMRAGGVRTWRPAPRSPVADDGLTGREWSIVQMIRAGASNPEIAEAMFVSRKTVERHVSNALAKTGARNRAELAGRVTTGELQRRDARIGGVR